MSIKLNKIILFIFLIFIIIILFTQKKDNTALVFKEESFGYDTYIVDVSNASINTKNLDEFQDDIDQVLPMINEKYSPLIISNWYIFDKMLSFDNNISNLENLYKNKYISNAFNKEALSVEYEGLKISKIRIVTNDINKYSKYKYEKVQFD